jgi:hypothetical protein
MSGRKTRISLAVPLAGDDLLQFGLALKQRQLPDVPAIEIEQIESDQDDPGGAAFELVLQHREVGGAVDSGHDDLAVDDGGAGLDVPGVVGDLPEAFGPVVAAAGEDLDRLVGQVDLDAVAVELDFVNPARPGRTEDARAGSMKPGKGALTPIAAGFRR